MVRDLISRRPLLAVLAAAGLLACAPSAGAATFTVNSNADVSDAAVDGVACDVDTGTGGDQCTLRAAIQEANFTVASDDIDVSGAISGQAVTLVAPLPQVSNPVNLDGCADNPNSQIPCFGVRPTDNTVSVGIVFASGAAASTIRGLAITEFGAAGVQVEAANVAVKNVWFGINVSFSIVGLPGIGLVVGGDGAQVGGTTGAPGDAPADRNRFAANGIALLVYGADNTVIEGNYFGMNVSGSQSGGANTANIQVIGPSGDAPSGTRIGDTLSAGAQATDSCDGACNVISNASGPLNGHGIDLQGGVGLASAGATTIRGNVIGGETIDFGVAGNKLHGINVGNAGPVTIGGTAAGQGNVILDNGTTVSGGAGIRIFGADSTTIQGNVIGTSLGSDQNRGNGVGILVASVESPANPATGTIIGAARSGTSCDGGCNTIVSSEGASFAGGSGILLSGLESGEDPAGATTIKGNMIGVDRQGDGELPNSDHGIDAGAATPVTIGGIGVGEANVISGNADHGIVTSGPASIVGNLIGVGSDGASAFPNDVSGATLTGAATFTANRVGGDGNFPDDGLRLAGTGATVTGNTFGVGPGGQDLGFNQSAIDVTGSASTIGPGNVIGNARFDTPSSTCCTAGVDIAGNSNVVKGNSIGVGAGGIDIGNEGAGVRLFAGASGNTIGGDTAADENVISNNGGPINRGAIEVRDSATNANTIARNVGVNNDNIFIDLLKGVATGLGNPLDGPHGGTQAPVITSAQQSTLVGTAPPGSLVRAFKASGPSGRDVDAFLGSATAADDGSFTVSLSPVAVGDLVTASQTTSFPGTSELAQPVAATADPAPATGGGGGGDPGATTTTPTTTTSTTTPADPAATVSSYRVGPTTFAAASRGGSIARAAIGTTVRYTLSEPARVTFTVERVRAGRRVSGRCRRPTRANQRRPRCDLLLAGSFSHAGRAGANRFRFTGRLRGRKLAPGLYKLVATARDAAGQRSRPVRTGFRIVRR